MPFSVLVCGLPGLPVKRPSAILTDRGPPSQNAGQGALEARVPRKLFFCSFLSLA